MEHPSRILEQLEEEERRKTVRFKIDHLVIQVVCAREEEGRKVGEHPVAAMKLFYPFDPEQLLKWAIEQARQQWEESGANAG